MVNLTSYNRKSLIRFGFKKSALRVALSMEPILPNKMAQRFRRSQAKLKYTNPVPLFFAEWYQRRYLSGTTSRWMQLPLAHYAEIGDAKGCRPNPFLDPPFYRSTNMDRRDRSTALSHYFAHNCSSRLIPHKAWNEQSYLDANADVALKVAKKTWASAFVYFCEVGCHEIIAESELRSLPVEINGKKSYFVEAWYLRDHSDVAEKVQLGEFGSGLEHFFLEGHAELEGGERKYLYTSARPEIIRFHEIRQTPNGRDLAVFAHYDPDGIVDEYVFHFLDALRKNDCDIVFVTAEMREEDEARLAKFCRRIYVKTASGRDFGSWALAVKHLGQELLDEYDYTILVNDSVYWPVKPDNVVFDSMRAAKHPMWGIVDSYQIGYHLQSWFLAFSKSKGRKILDDFVEKFMGSYEMPKGAQIYEYEVWFTQQAMRNGLEIGSFCPIEDVKESFDQEKRSTFRLCSHHQVNPSIDAWHVLLSEYGCPALKIQLLRESPAKADYVEKWHTFVDPEVVHLISNHLRRVGTQVKGLPLPTFPK